MAPKSEPGRRTVAIARTLRLHLMEHRLSRGRRDGLFFGRKNGKAVLELGGQPKGSESLLPPL